MMFCICKDCLLIWIIYWIGDKIKGVFWLMEIIDCLEKVVELFLDFF